MTLLEALAKAVDGKEIHVQAADGEIARTVFFVFTEIGDSAFLSEVELEELVPLLEKWCQEQRFEMGRVH